MSDYESRVLNREKKLTFQFFADTSCKTAETAFETSYESRKTHARNVTITIIIYDSCAIPFNFAIILLSGSQDNTIANYDFNMFSKRNNCKTQSFQCNFPYTAQIVNPRNRHSATTVHDRFVHTKIIKRVFLYFSPAV